MKKLIIILLVCWCNTILFGQLNLSDKAEISILTCSPGEDLYNTFGHTAIRVKDDTQNFDIVFNYGTFSFGGRTVMDQIKFGVTFARGTLLYHLSVSKFSNFINSYIYNKRSVYEQVLNLDIAQTQQLYLDLVENAKKENKYYHYDFFFDNCSSRVRDMIENSVNSNSKVRFTENPEAIHQESGLSFMDMIDPYIENSPWTKFGIYILLGLPANQDASDYEQMFLPDYLMHNFANAEKLESEEWKPLAQPAVVLYGAPDRVFSNPFYLSPFFVFGVLFALVAFVSYRNYQFDKHIFLIDYLFLGTTGFIGFLLLFMWFGTDHATTKVNLNLLWAIPMNFIAIFILRKKPLTNYWKSLLVIIFCLLITWQWFPQKMHSAFIPIVGILMVRYLKILSWYKRGRLVKA